MCTFKIKVETNLIFFFKKFEKLSKINFKILYKLFEIKTNNVTNEINWKINFKNFFLSQKLPKVCQIFK